MQPLNDKLKTITIDDSKISLNPVPTQFNIAVKVDSEMSETASIRKLQICFFGIFVSYFIYGILQEKMLVIDKNMFPSKKSCNLVINTITYL